VRKTDNLHVPIIMISGNPNLLEPLAPVQGWLCLYLIVIPHGVLDSVFTTAILFAIFIFPMHYICYITLILHDSIPQIMLGKM
jgi:hypothetical protein